MRLLITLSAFTLIGFTACNNGTNSTTTTKGDSTASHPAPPAPRKPESKLGEDGTAKLMAMVSKYYELKNAFVATKPEDAAAAAAKVTIAADSLQAYLDRNAATGASLKAYVDTIIKGSQAIVAVNEKNCDKQRVPFETVSNAVYNLLKAAEVKNAGIYHEYCPMAFDDKGAFWLSDDMDIKNPYFGKKMLECGEVKDSL